MFCTFTIQLKNHWDVLLRDNEAVISANPVRLSLFHKTSFLHVAMRKLQGSLQCSFVYSAKIQGHPVASVPGRCWAGERMSVQGKENVGQEGILRLMSETLSPVKGAVPSAPETVWCCDEPSGLVFTGHEQFKSQKQCLLILVLEERLTPLAGSAVELWLYWWLFWTVLCPRHGCELWLTAQLQRHPFVSPPEPPEVTLQRLLCNWWRERNKLLRNEELI